MYRAVLVATTHNWQMSRTSVDELLAEDSRSQTRLQSGSHLQCNCLYVIMVLLNFVGAQAILRKRFKAGFWWRSGILAENKPRDPGSKHGDCQIFFLSEIEYLLNLTILYLQWHAIKDYPEFNSKVNDDYKTFWTNKMKRSG